MGRVKEVVVVIVCGGHHVVEEAYVAELVATFMIVRTPSVRRGIGEVVDGVSGSVAVQVEAVATVRETQNARGDAGFVREDLCRRARRDVHDREDALRETW